jgi:hypothetical protein
MGTRPPQAKTVTPHEAIYTPGPVHVHVCDFGKAGEGPGLSHMNFRAAASVWR